eukprot:850593_1
MTITTTHILIVRSSIRRILGREDVSMKKQRQQNDTSPFIRRRCSSLKQPLIHQRIRLISMEMKKSHHNTRQNHSNHHQNTWCITSAKCDLRMDSVNGNEHILIVRSSISKGNEYDDEGEEATKEPPPDTPPTATQHPQED